MRQPIRVRGKHLVIRWSVDGNATANESACRNIWFTSNRLIGGQKCDSQIRSSAEHIIKIGVPPEKWPSRTRRLCRAHWTHPIWKCLPRTTSNLQISMNSIEMKKDILFLPVLQLNSLCVTAFIPEKNLTIGHFNCRYSGLLVELRYCNTQHHNLSTYVQQLRACVVFFHSILILSATL